MKSKQDFAYSFTVFTPTYNRAHLLPRVYECLVKQTFKDFEWLIVDDGSTDNTAEVVKEWQAASPFQIRYVAQPNSGKHIAVNRGAQAAKGRFFAILDSDDWYVPHSLERFLHFWDQIPACAKPEFVGVVGLCSYHTGEIIGSPFPMKVFDSDVIDLRYRYKVEGEKNGVLRTDVVREFPFPEGIGKFISESIVWNRMATKYKTRFVNEMLTVKEYQQGGLSDIGRVNQVRNTRASLLCARELIALGNRLPLGPRVRAYANYIRLSLHQAIPLRQQAAEAPSKLMFLLCLPLGAYLKTSDLRFIESDKSARTSANQKIITEKYN